MKLQEFRARHEHKLHKAQHFLHHLHHIVEACVALAVSSGLHYIEVSASGILSVVVLFVIALDVMEA